ncbi:hypothetical protein HQ545_06190 [Candidatus Woesearchaeota archaeon]|nr:hypothetical protein [Candidatus Woesearchaeota archaeon]
MPKDYFERLKDCTRGLESKISSSNRLINRGSQLGQEVSVTAEMVEKWQDRLDFLYSTFPELREYNHSR